VLLIAACYALGYAVIGIGENIVLPAYEFLCGILRKSGITAWLVPNTVVSRKELFANIRNDPLYKAFLSSFQSLDNSLANSDVSNDDVNAWRNIAMTVAQEQNHTVYRFSVIFMSNFLRYSTPVIVHSWFAIPLLIIPLIFLERRYQFYARAMRTPFSMALAKLMQSQVQGKSTSKEQLVVQSVTGTSQPKVYLAGGFRSGWQDRVIAGVSRFSFFDPRVHGLQDNGHYTLWDLEAIRRSDLVFAYLEATNPGGYALALEVGFAKALGKRIILVDEKGAADEHAGRSLGMAHAVADVSFRTFDEGFQYLQLLEKSV
jgi:hypothetical protein